jgi:hypothetical protein
MILAPPWAENFDGAYQPSEPSGRENGDAGRSLGASESPPQA